MSIAGSALLALRRPLEMIGARGTQRLVDRYLRGARGERDVRLSTGVRMRVDLADRLERLYAFRAYERDEVRLIMRTLQPGDHMIDAGAHTGYFALHAAVAVGPGGTVHAFEPSPRNAQRLRANRDLNGFTNVAVTQAAVSETSGRAHFQLVTERGETGWGSLMLDPAENTDDIEVDVVNLDTYTARANVPTVRLLKMDVQGNELAVLRGAANMIDRDEPDIVCELVDVWWGSAQTTTVGDLLAWLDARGYRGTWIGHRGRLRPLALGEQGGPINALFTKRDARAAAIQ